MYCGMHTGSPILYVTQHREPMPNIIRIARARALYHRKPIKKTQISFYWYLFSFKKNGWAACAFAQINRNIVDNQKERSLESCSNIGGGSGLLSTRNCTWRKIKIYLLPKMKMLKRVDIAELSVPSRKRDHLRVREAELLKSLLMNTKQKEKVLSSFSWWYECWLNSLFNIWPWTVSWIITWYPMLLRIKRVATNKTSCYE